MPVMADQIAALAVNTSSGNVLAGKIYEFAPIGGAVLEVGCTCDVVGVTATLITGTDILVNGEKISFANRYPVYPDDYIYNDVVAGGERLVLSFFNTSAAARIVNWAVKVTPL